MGARAQGADGRSREPPNILPRESARAGMRNGGEDARAHHMGGGCVACTACNAPAVKAHFYLRYLC